MMNHRESGAVAIGCVMVSKHTPEMKLLRDNRRDVHVYFMPPMALFEELCFAEGGSISDLKEILESRYEQLEVQYERCPVGWHISDDCPFGVSVCFQETKRIEPILRREAGGIFIDSMAPWHIHYGSNYSRWSGDIILTRILPEDLEEVFEDEEHGQRCPNRLPIASSPYDDVVLLMLLKIRGNAVDHTEGLHKLFHSWQMNSVMKINMCVQDVKNKLKGIIPSGEVVGQICESKVVQEAFKTLDDRTVMYVAADVDPTLQIEANRFSNLYTHRYTSFGSYWVGHEAAESSDGVIT